MTLEQLAEKMKSFNPRIRYVTVDIWNIGKRPLQVKGWECMPMYMPINTLSSAHDTWVGVGSDNPPLVECRLSLDELGLSDCSELEGLKGKTWRWKDEGGRV